MDVPDRALNLQPLDPATATLDRPRLSVVLVNYQRWDDTLRLVGQLRRSRAMRDGSAEIVVIDNASPSHPAIRKLRRTPGVTLLRWRANQGFARAANEGCRQGRGDWVLLLNPDMTARPGFLDQALQRADSLAHAEPRAGVVGFRLVHADGSPQFSTGLFPTLGSTLTRLLLPRGIRKYTHPEGRGPRPVDWVTGCCMLVRRDCWAALGGLDPSFFLYYEDVDFCLRARRAGWSVWFDPSATIMHHRPLHAREVQPHIRLVTRHALLTYAGKHWSAWQRNVLSGIVRLEANCRWLAARLRGDSEATATFRELGRVVAELGEGRTNEAHDRLVTVVRSQERNHVAPILGRHSESQSPRPAPRLPGERLAPCPAWDGMAGR